MELMEHTEMAKGYQEQEAEVLALAEEALAAQVETLPEEPKKKTCSRCGLEKLATEFQRDSSHGDGLKSSCKSCRNLGRAKKKDSRDPVMAQAQNLAARQLIENHLREFKMLVADNLRDLGHKPKWVSVK